MVLSYGALHSRANVRVPRCRVLQYVHDFLTVGCESDKNLNLSRWIMAYGSKEDLYLILWLDFTTLVIFNSRGCLLELQS